ncbi:unnamed protein product [Allacma fusca]|uniref:Uncharacterized protein n=1 Tax=Allacma fusca TaxID=39272 RepID=A0A8J2KZC8_9HEXA|nr:unnamed protein product [Allacma fusca]
MDFQSAMETFAEAWVAANTGKIGLNVSTAVPTLPDTRLESPLQQQLQVQERAELLGSWRLSCSCEDLQKNTYLLNPRNPWDFPRKHVKGAQGNSKAVGADGGSLPSDYPKIPSGMDLSSSAGSTTSPPAKRLKGIPTRKLSPSHNNNNSPDFHSSAGSTSATTATTTPLISNSQNIPNTLGKSMPIHCIIEVSNSSGGVGSGSRKDSISLESALSTASNNNLDIINQDCSSTGKVVEVDDFVIIPAGTPFQDVVTTVLTLLGYPKDIIRQAEGTISLRNWKPLRLDQVCDSPSKTVGDILNDLTNHATLRVLVTRAKGGSTEDLKEKLLRLLLAHSSTLLMGAGCPLDEMTMSQLVKGQWPQNLAEDVKRRFDQWYQSLHPGATLGLLESLQHSHMQQQHAGNSHHLPTAIMPANAASIHLPSHHHNHLVNGSGGHHHQQQSLHHHHDLQSNKSSSFIDDDHNHPVFHGLAAQKTRMRTSFDPEMELPKLQQWFAENPHPSRHQIQQYVRELNMLECRKDRKPLDVNNVIYWFKNARAAQKRNELRYNGLPHHQTYAHHPQPLGPSSHSHLLHSSHGLLDCRDRAGSQPPHPSMEASNGESCNDHSGASSCRDSDDQDPEISKENMDDHRDMKDSDGMLRNIKEERDEDFINVDVDGGGPGLPRSPRETKDTTNNNEEPKDLSSKSPEDQGEDTSDEKADFPDNKDGNDTKRIEKIEVTLEENVDSNAGVDMGENSNNSISSSASPRSSPGISPSHNYDFNGPPSMVNRYHPFFEHPSFIAYRHFNSFNFGPNFPGSNSSEGSAYEAALNAARKSLLPVGKPSGSLDMFPEFPQGLNPQMVPNGRGSSSAGNLSGGVASSCDPLSRLRAEELFPSRPASSADIINSIINSNRGEFSPLNLGSHHHNSPNSLGIDERRKRNRTFIDPVTEVVLLENWFKIQTHPSHNLILKYTEELNRMPYRQKFPKLEPKNVQFWFKNRRAKCKRLKMNM